MMLPNNNRAIIKKLTGRTLKANKTRNWMVMMAIALTTFLIASVFSIGMSYLKSYHLQQIRVMGTAAHSALTKATDGQLEQLHEYDYVDSIGKQAMAGRIVRLPEWGPLTVSLYWFDQTEWEQHRKPAMTDITGQYPQQEDEVMIATWLLERMGIKEPKLGTEIELTTIPDDNEGRKSEAVTSRFKLSGYYTEYMNVRAANQGIILVSEAFADKKGISVEKSGSLTVKYKDGLDVSDTSSRLERDLQLNEQSRQKVKTVPLYASSDSNSGLMIGFGCLILFIMLSGYLLIYNVLYISVSKDIRYYGLLKTIGTTPRQIKRIVMGQAFRLSLIGIPAGLAVSTIASFAIVPLALNTYNVSETGIAISFSPWIFTGAVLFALLTTWVGCVKPARLAAGISPIEAVRYTGVTIKRKLQRGTHGGHLRRMAVRNMFRDKKRAVLVFISLFMGITTFMTVNTVVMSLDFDHFVESYIDNDFELYNNSANRTATGERTPFITQQLIADIQDIPGITDVRATTTEPIQLFYDPELYGKHNEAFAKDFDIDPVTEEQIKDNPEMFWSLAVGIDSKYVKEINRSKAPMDIAAFERGEIALISTDNPELYKLSSEMNFKILNNERQYKIRLGGFLPKNFQVSRGGLAPNIYISEQAMDRLVDEPFVERVNIQSDDKQAESILAELKGTVDSIGGLTINAKIEMEENFASLKLMLSILGGGLSAILALIGILNFINVMFTGVTVRKQEMAVMESIGMTKRQLQRMLVYEGLGYAILSSGLIMTLGSLITYGVFRLFRTEADYAVFTYPYVPTGAAIVFIFVVCLSVPVAAYKSSSKETVTERLRSSEG
ncbi:ABC transporter permease [Paenibacillus sp. DMB20]|uniref:ABC transporter permease n=1 Tax=Paenibacillus sp. DMB20 TaxID=1642570 RepID=UPI000627C710|nr:ABC transporter permease [Paenibacillus sp. DMB20]KKO54792.1 hypothetical protein XI25_04740 [Paenibacillus sp. DMB20]